MQIFRDEGYQKSGLDALCQESSIVKEEGRHHRSAIHDADMLMAICKKRTDLLLMLDHLYGYIFNDIVYH